MIKKQQVLTILRYTIICVFAISMILPVFWMFITSFKDPMKVFSRPIDWWVDSFDFSNYTKLFTKYNGWRYIWNTIRLCAINVVGVVLSNSIVAYAMAFKKFKHKKKLLVLMLATMMMPGTVTFFPRFLVFVELGWYGTLLPLWVPSFLGNAYYIFLLRQYYLSIPQYIIDAARVSGCNDLQMLIKVVLPMSRPVLTIMVLGTFIGTWSDLFNPLIYILNEKDKTFPLLLTLLKDSYGNNGTLPSIMAGGLIAAIPTLLVYFLGQRYMNKAYVFRSGDR